MKLRLNLGATLVLLAATALFGAAYMSFGVLHTGPVAQSTHITLLLEKSGGVLPTSDVTMRGVKVGRVTGVRTTATGIAVSLEISGGQQVPVDSPVGVEALSAAGEQYIDFKPKRIAPPYFADGAVIPAEKATYHATVSEMLERSTALFKAFDPNDLSVITKNIDELLKGSDETLDQLSVDSAVYAHMVQNEKHVFTALINNIDFLVVHLGKARAAAVLNKISRQLPPTARNADRLFEEIHVLFDYFTPNGVPTSPVATDGAVEELVAKISEYADDLSDPMSTFAPALEAVTAPLREDKVDVGSWIGLWGSALDEQGNLKVRLHLSQPPQQGRKP